MLCCFWRPQVAKNYIAALNVNVLCILKLSYRRFVKLKLLYVRSGTIGMFDSDCSISLAAFTAIGVSDDCCSNIYCGTGPVSEPEAQAVTYFVGSRKEDFLCFLTIHSYGQLLLVPYGHPNYTAPNYQELVFTSRNTVMHV